MDIAKEIQDELDGIDVEFVATVEDTSIGLRGHVVIDRSFNGHACGGLRMDRSVSVDRMKALARGMTLKYAFSGMGQGGAKAGIEVCDEIPPEEKRRLLRRFGQLASPLLATAAYITGPDMNIGPEDIQEVMAGAGISFPAVRRSKGRKSGYYTALSVMVAIEACAQHRSLDLGSATMAIQGFGSVGSSLALLMARKKRTRVVAVSTDAGAVYNRNGLDVDLLLDLRVRHGNRCVEFYKDADRISKDDLLLLDADIVSPCAGQFMIGADSAEKVRARIFSPGANNPVTRGADLVLLRRGILSVPHFAANCGGVLGNRMEVLDVGDEFIENVIRRKNVARIRELIRISETRNVPMIQLAEEYAWRRLARMRESARRTTLRKSLYAGALGVFNTGLVPPLVRRALGAIYLTRTMTRDPDVEEA